MEYIEQWPMLWEHTCCQSTRWSGARLCDRCGRAAAATVHGVAVADAMARLSSMDDGPLAIAAAAAPARGHLNTRRLQEGIH